jgi:DNA repair exonuclease SbcCD ATPase subunit
MTLVVGKNGSGKSTMIDALCYALFNRAFRFKSAKAWALVNSINDSNMCVELEFSKGNREYKVVRGLKPQIFTIYEDGNEIKISEFRDYQKYLETQILGFNIKSFSQIVVIGSNSFTPFMKLSSSDRRAVIENVLDIEIFSIMNNILKVKLKAIGEKLEQLKNLYHTNQQKIELQKKYIQESKRQNQDLIQSKKDELVAAQTIIEENNNKLKQLQESVEQYLEQITEENKVRESIRKLESYRIKIESNIKSHNQDIEFFKNNKLCPRCNQDIQNSEHMISQCDQKLRDLTTGLGLLETKQGEYEQKLTEIQDIQKIIERLKRGIWEHNSIINEKYKQIHKLNTELEELANKKPVSEDLLKVSQELISELENINNSRKEIINKKQYYDLATGLLKDSGIKSKIIKQYLPVINKLINKYLSSMDFFVDFQLDEEFNETIKSRYRDKFNYENFSEGQKRRIDLSLLFTWRAVAKLKNSINCNLLILDEILDGSLDSDGMEEFMKLLNAVGNDNNVYLISHRGDILADKFTNVLQFESKNNFSEVAN